MQELIAGVDIGGTNVRVALAALHEPDCVLAHHIMPTPADQGPDAYLDLIEQGIDVCLLESDRDGAALQGIGCTVPGITDAAGGRALFVSNLKDWDGYPIAQALSDRLGVDAVVDNDVNAAALGEYWFGCGRGSHSLVYMTISTGVAAGIVVGGQLIRGFHHAAGELGFVLPDPQHIGKDWSPNGCLELLAAGVGLGRLWAEARSEPEDEVSAIDVFQAAQTGHEEAMRLVSRAADYLAQTVVAICTVVDPEKFVLSGSIAQHQPMLLQRVREVAADTLPFATTIELSRLKGDAPLVGALALVSKSLAGLRAYPGPIKNGNSAQG